MNANAAAPLERPADESAGYTYKVRPAPDCLSYALSSRDKHNLAHGWPAPQVHDRDVRPQHERILRSITAKYRARRAIQEARNRERRNADVPATGFDERTVAA